MMEKIKEIEKMVQIKDPWIYIALIVLAITLLIGPFFGIDNLLKQGVFTLVVAVILLVLLALYEAYVWLKRKKW